MKTIQIRKFDSSSEDESRSEEIPVVPINHDSNEEEEINDAFTLNSSEGEDVEIPVVAIDLQQQKVQSPIVHPPNSKTKSSPYRKIYANRVTKQDESVKQDKSDENIENAIEEPKKVENTGKLFYKHYVVVRQTKSSIKGARIYFKLIDNGEEKYFAKAKGKHPNVDVHVSECSDIHIKGSFEYSIKCKKDHRHFSLYDHLKKKSIMKYELIKEKLGKEKMPKSVHLTLAPEFNIDTLEFMTKQPKKNGNGCWTYDFHNRITVPSEKNKIFTRADDRNGKELFMVRKVTEATLEVDCFVDLPPLLIFSVATCIYLTKFH